MAFIVPSTVLRALHTVSVFISQQTYYDAFLATSTDEKSQTHRFLKTCELKRVVSDRAGIPHSF